MARIDERRRALLIDLGDAPDLRGLVQAFVFPLAESLGHDEGVSWYARFLRQVIFDPDFDAFAQPRRMVTGGMRAVIDGLNEHLRDLPEPVRMQRLLRVTQLIVNALADQEAHMATGRVAPAELLAGGGCRGLCGRRDRGAYVGRHRSADLETSTEGKRKSMKIVDDPGAALDAKRIKLEPWDVQVGPLGYLAAERERMDRLRWENFDVRRLGATIGAVVDGIELADPASRPYRR